MLLQAEAVSSQPKRETRRARRNINKRKARVLMYDEDTTEISKKIFAAWLEDRSDIVGHHFVSQVRYTNPLFKKYNACLVDWVLKARTHDQILLDTNWELAG